MSNRCIEWGMANVTIIVVNWNLWRNMIESLESLRRITYLNYKIIVGENGSTDDSTREHKHGITNQGGDFADVSLRGWVVD